MKLKGLSSVQAEKLLKEYGLNYIPRQHRKSLLQIFLSQFNNFLILLLLGASLISIFVGEITDGLLIFSIVILNALFGVYQEKKAEKSIDELSKITVTKSRVIRDGYQQEIDSKYLVPGDLVFLEEGVKIPADGKLIEAVNLTVNEASLTGESLPVEKKIGDKVYMGTIVTGGRGFFKVIETAERTQLGQVIVSVKEVEEVKTPLQKRLERTTKVVGYLGIFAAVIVFALSFLKTGDYFSSFLLAIALAVAVVPEGLPAVLTITLSLGVKRLAKKKTIVRKLESIEALGSITVLATDKTGTLTQNKMRVKDVYLDRKTFSSTEFKNSKERSSILFFLTSVLCSTASLGKGGMVLGDPTEGALLLFALEKGVDVSKLRKTYPLLREESFDSKKKIMSVTISYNGKNISLLKGAPEIILQSSNFIIVGGKRVPLSSKFKKEIEEQIDRWAAQGSRILAFSVKEGNEMSFVGMVALYDPPREKIEEAVKRARIAGIRPVIVTGDNEKTAITIGKIAGIYREGDRVLTGDKIDKMNDAQLKIALERTTIFARTTPFHKARITRLYQEMGEIVAVTGDGVNDAIALHQADVGVAMGQNGTDAAKEAADIIILDDNFKTIIDAVEEGRRITYNLQKAIKYLLSCNTAEVLSLIIALFLRVPRIFYPIQLLYINLVTDGMPALALSFSPGPSTLMRGRIRKTNFLEEADLIQMGYIGLFVTFLVFLSLFALHKTAAAFTVLTLTQSVIFLYMWSSGKILGKGKYLRSSIFLSSFLLPFILQYLIVSNSYVASLFRIKTLSPVEYLILVLLSFSLLLPITFISSRIKFSE